ncbi:MAG: hypothetical protein KatS3mg090_0185 [Patescibacteria group bacterium]|nr:MAG: hypothetical protein KatS3mg090_0185 [Patescibacteria group bacterium]
MLDSMNRSSEHNGSGQRFGSLKHFFSNKSLRLALFNFFIVVFGVLGYWLGSLFISSKLSKTSDFIYWGY